MRDDASDMIVLARDLELEIRPRSGISMRYVRFGCFDRYDGLHIRVQARYFV